MVSEETCVFKKNRIRNNILTNKKNIKIYHVWKNMMRRCLNSNSPYYYRYGKRGITVCKKWLLFKNFFEDMSPTYKEYLSLDRIDNNKGYSKKNCRWTTKKIQANNKENNVFLTLNNETLTASQWAEKLKIKPHTILQRVRNNWTPEQVLQPVRKKGSSVFKGVSFKKDKNKWCVQINRNGKNKFFGYFDTEEKASDYYQLVIKSF